MLKGVYVRFNPDKDDDIIEFLQQSSFSNPQLIKAIVRKYIVEEGSSVNMINNETDVVNRDKGLQNVTKNDKTSQNDTKNNNVPQDVTEDDGDILKNSNLPDFFK